jgi:hypothetical protein
MMPSLVALLLSIALYPKIQVLAQSLRCNTNQNPYCAGNDDFESLCCPSPNVCYWADRQGTPACCPYGQVCLDRDGFTVTAQPV